MPSVKHFTIVNSAFFSVGYITFYIYKSAFTAMPLWFFILNFIFSEVMKKIYINQSTNRSHLHIAKKILPIAIINSLTLYLSCQLFCSSDVSLTREIIMFIPFSFAFEVIFDFFHYIFHRLFHTLPVLYKYHSIHHREAAISVYTTFEHHPIDLIGTNVIPVLLTSLLLRPSPFFICVWMIYKVVEEMSGHAGVYIKSSSFPQFVWLPRLLGIELYNSDHTYHHTHPSKNFAKRFRLWDKVFDTHVATRQP